MITEQKSTVTYQQLMETVDKNYIALLEPSIAFKDLRKNVARQEALIQQMSRFLRNFCDQFEAKFDSDEDAFSYEEMHEYVEAAQFMSMHFQRTNNRLRHVRERINKLPFGI